MMLRLGAQLASILKMHVSKVIAYQTASYRYSPRLERLVLLPTIFGYREVPT